MKHVVTVWGTTLQTEEELQSFLAPVYDESGQVTPSGFLDGTGLNAIDEDFFEAYLLDSAKERASFLAYLEEEYAPDAQGFAQKLPNNLAQSVAMYPSVILLYGNASRYGSINEELFQLAEKEQIDGSPVVLLAKIVYGTDEG